MVSGQGGRLFPFKEVSEMKLHLWILPLVVLPLIAGCKDTDGPTAPDDLSATSESPQGPVGDPVMVTPYARAGDMANISALFSKRDNCPWGGEHAGIDFHPTGNLRPFQAVFSGTVIAVDLTHNRINGLWQVDVSIRFNSTYYAYYGFEPMTASKQDGQIQLDNILVSVGQAVSKGDVIGNLLASGEGTHVHWGLFRDSESRLDINTCPEPFFSSPARDSIMNIVHRDHPGWGMCY
jgi:murein DD-endopeptidase MepM/ murein hydrolase activator NlpD